MRLPTAIELIPAGPVLPALLAELAADLHEHTSREVVHGPPLPLDPAWHRDGRIESRGLMHALLDLAGRDRTRWRLAITDAALCDEALGEIFGEAAFGGCCAVVGTGPLRRGSGADADVLRGRLLTEALHELGHLAGLEHCRRASCVMYPSLDIAESDRKGTSFCADCGRKSGASWKRKT